MSKIITNRILNGFLIKHRIKGKFLYNCTKHADHPVFNFIELKTLNQSYEHRSTIIMDSFHWKPTSQGHDFWSNYNRMYREYHAKHYKSIIGKRSKLGGTV